MSYSLKLADPRLKWESLLDSSPHFAVGWELHVKKFPKRELLNDGRIFVIEYKGAIYVDASQEKKNIGERWEDKSDNKGIFLLAVKKDEKGRDVHKQIEDRISGKH
jgi:hypothetical protein